jgi:hypothetical protein
MDGQAYQQETLFMAAVVRSRFYPLIALALAAVIVAGFARTYYLRVFFQVPPITVLLHLHALVFSAWLLLFVTQTRLIARQNYALHMKVGMAGVVLAVLVVIVGYMTAIVGAHVVRPRPMGMGALEFLIFPLTSIVLFAVFVAAAVSLRRKAALHKRFMVLAMIAVLGPPVARLIRFSELGEHFIAIQTVVTAAFVVWALLYDWFKYRMIHPVFAVGGTLLVVLWPLREAAARSDTWLAIAARLVG